MQISNALGIAAFLLLTYSFICFVAHILTPKSLFKPQKSSYTMTGIPNGYFVTLTNGVKMAASYAPVPDAKYVIFFCHGNRSDIGYMKLYQEYFNNLGFSFFIYDYAGYGCSSGKPSIKNIEQSVLPIYDDFLQRFNVRPEQVIVYGRSLGGGPAIYLAAQRPVAGLMTDGTFMSVYRIKTRWPILMGDKLKNFVRIAKVRAPYFAMHGQADTLINPIHGATLFERARSKKICWWIPQFKHEDHPIDFEEFKEKLSEFLRLIEAQNAADAPTL